MSKAYHQYSKNQGFTLIEILAVVIIIGLIASAIALSLGDKKVESVTRKEAQAFLQAVDFVSEQAVFNGEIIGMFVQPKDSEDSLAKKWCYHWQRFRDERWQDLPDDTLSEHCMPDNMQWDMVVEGKIYAYEPELETQPPVFVWSPSGESTPIEMSIFENGSNAEAQHIEITMMGEIHWRNQEEEEKRSGR